MFIFTVLCRLFFFYCPSVEGVKGAEGCNRARVKVRGVNRARPGSHIHNRILISKVKCAVNSK